MVATRRDRVYSPEMICYCCGEERDPATMAQMVGHGEVNVCRGCIGWLQSKAGGVDVTPTLPVHDMDAATSFCELAGFDVQRYDQGFAFVRIEDQSLFDLDLFADMDPATNHAGCYIVTPHVETWHARFVEVGLSVTAIQDMPWGMREFTLTDPSRNNIRIGRAAS